MPPSDTTTATRKAHPLLTAVLDEVPASALGPKERAGLAKALRRVDALGVVDERTGRPYVVEERLRDLLRPVFDEDEISAHIDDLRAHAP